MRHREFQFRKEAIIPQFLLLTLCILKQSALFMHLLVQLLPVWMLPVHSQHCSPTVCMHTHRTDFITSFPSQTLCYTKRDREPALWFFLSICTHACVTNAAASEKQRKLSLCPSNASSLCAVAFFRRFFATLTPHCCSAKIGLIAVYTQQRALSASLDKASMWKCEE